jgi:hypothetical protein
MTRFFILIALLLGSAGFVFSAEGQPPVPPRFVVVVDASAGRDEAAIDDATRAVTAARRGAEGELRITRTPTEQLSVTRYFAARGYDIVGVGLDPGIAVDPVAERYPSTRFTLVDSRDLPATVAAVAAR